MCRKVVSGMLHALMDYPGCFFEAVREFSEKELSSVTNNYKEKVGKGAFGIVFKGTLQHVPVAIKVLDPVSLFTLCAPVTIALLTCYRCCFQIPADPPSPQRSVH